MQHLKLTAAAVAALILLAVLPLAAASASDAENEAAVLRHLQQLARKFGNTVVPRLNQSTEVDAEFLFMPKRLVSVNSAAQTLKVSGIMILFWEDELLVWNSSSFGGVNKLFMNSGRVWKPDVLLPNAVGEKHVLKVNGELSLRSLSANRTSVNAMWQREFEFSCQFNMSKFPQDHQVCQLELMATIFGDPGNQVVSRARNVEKQVLVTMFAGNTEWQLVNFAARNKSVTLQSPGGEYEANIFVAEFHIKRHSMYYTVVLMLPLLLLTLLQLLTYLVPLDSGEKIGCGVTVLLSFTVFLLLLDNIVPKSEEVPFIVNFIAVSMVVSAASLLYNALLLRMHHMSSDTPMPKWMQIVMLNWIGCCMCVQGCSSSCVQQQQQEQQEQEEPLQQQQQQQQKDAKADVWQKAAVAMERLGLVIHTVLVAALIAAVEVAFAQK